MTSIPMPDARPTPACSLPAWGAIAMALMSGCLLASALSLHPYWWTAWAAPIPLYAAALAGPPGRGRWLGALAGAVSGLSLLDYTVSNAGWPSALIILALRTLFWSAMAGAAERSARTLPAWLAVLVPPLLAAGVETLVLTLSPHGANGSLAHSQVDILPLIQVASLGGLPAIVFLVLCGGGLGGLLAARLMGAAVPARQLALAAGLVLAIGAAALVFGAVRLAAEHGGREAPVALIVTDRFVDAPPRDWRRVWGAYAAAVEAAARPGVVVVLPEKIAWLTTAQADEAAREISALARAGGATLLVGLEVEDRRPGGGFANRALVAGPDGSVAWYDKRRPVPGLEARIRAGKRALVVNAGGARAGVAICKDMHFPALGREYGRAGVPLVLVPAWDFVRDGWISDRLTLLRGVESGYAVARTSREGISSLSDRFGRVLVEGASRAETRTLSGMIRLPDHPRPTLYAQVGDLFGWGCLAAAAAMGLWIRRRRAAPED